ncbi:MAG: EamA family transporter [Actinomycetota bacterium]
MLKIAPLAILSVLLATGGQLLLKAGMENVGYVGGDQLRRPAELALTLLKTPQVVIGLGLFVVSAGSWLLVLSRVPLSVAYPFVGLTYVLTTLFAKFALKENVPTLRWLGIGLILLGIAFVGQTVSHQTADPKPSSAATSR